MKTATATIQIKNDKTKTQIMRSLGAMFTYQSTRTTKYGVLMMVDVNYEQHLVQIEVTDCSITIDTPVGTAHRIIMNRVVKMLRDYADVKFCDGMDEFGNGNFQTLPKFEY
jgi:hypothetical protein